MIFAMCSRDMAYLNQLQAWSYLFSSGLTASEAEEQIDWILITKQKSEKK